jgi:hypothetical protein
MPAFQLEPVGLLPCRIRLSNSDCNFGSPQFAIAMTLPTNPQPGDKYLYEIYRPPVVPGLDDFFNGRRK